MALGGLVARQLGQAVGAVSCRNARAILNLFSVTDRRFPAALQKRHSLNSLVTRALSTVTTSEKQTSLNDNSEALASIDPDGQILTVTWANGSKSRFHSIWLRHNCRCSQCCQESSSQRLFNPSTLPHHIRIDSVHIYSEGVELRWKGEEGHVGQVSLDYLQNHCYEAQSLKAKRSAVSLDKPVKTLPQIHYNDLIKGNKHVLKWLRQINEAGVSLMKGVPAEVTMIKEVAEYVGPVDDLIYGQVWDVVSTPQPINVAYSSVHLDFHMDLMYYESPPGLQFLHCLRFDDCVEGGESQFLDVFHVAEEFRQTHPDYFHTLARVPATFQKIHYTRENPVEMKYQRPHIILNHYEEVVCVNWSPAFEGPLAVEQEDVLPYYEAYEAFAKAIHNSAHIVEYRMQQGDLVTFNNRRILHARSGFDLNGGTRHLRGCYINIDQFKNRISVLSHLHGNGEPIKRVGNQDWF